MSTSATLSATGGTARKGRSAVQRAFGASLALIQAVYDVCSEARKMQRLAQRTYPYLNFDQ